MNDTDRKLIKEGASPPIEPNRSRFRHNMSGYFLIGLGILFLLDTVGIYTGNVWSWIGRLWPLILIWVGINAIFETNHKKEQPSSEAEYKATRSNIALEKTLPKPMVHDHRWAYIMIGLGI